ncbi:hypothetical protein D3C85_690350 [compost metagenome]
MLAMSCKIVTGLTVLSSNCSTSFAIRFGMTLRSAKRFLDVKLVSDCDQYRGFWPAPIVRIESR